MVCKITKILIAKRYFAPSAFICMVLFKKIADLQAWLNSNPQAGKQLGFIPTMGALHEGHKSLVAQAVADGVYSICSIFVNPSQFNDKADFSAYPVTPGPDLALLADAGCDVVFMPDTDEIYPEGTEQSNNFTFGYLETVLEGFHRPGHFKGVGQVVNRLLEIVQPDILYMGGKDYQQCLIVREMLEQTGKSQDVRINICPTVREADGLAMSSRNRRLTEPQRAIAGIIYQCLVSVQSKQKTARFSVLQKECTELMQAKGIEPEYIALADARNLSLLADFDHSIPMIVLIAAKIGQTRLIDNILLSQPEDI